jgi:hypothetical protein
VSSPKEPTKPIPARVSVRPDTLILHCALLLTACGGQSAHPGADTPAERRATAGDESRTQRAREDSDSSEAESDYLEECQGKMNTTTGVELKLPLFSEEHHAALQQARSQIFERLAQVRCTSASTGFVLTRIPKDAQSVSLAGGTLEDCQAVECVRAAVAEAASDVAFPKERDHTLGVQLDANGHLGEHDPTTQVPFQREYCGTQLHGRLPALTIRATVRKNFGPFAQCYLDGLRRDPKLEGRITARFVIERDGAVSSATAVNYTIPDCDVGACLLKSFESLKFPAPEGGPVRVTYPIMFSPD